MLGYRRTPHLHVAEATFPVAGDIRTRYGFHRFARHHQLVALNRWQDTDGMLDYVGEWHTHPEDHPAPSNVDRSHWRQISERSERPMLFLIVGRVTDWVGLGHGNRIDTVF
ncbi:Mov34/MPN/PAD-1 family protein [Chitinimonas viridis]|uniref:Mov34/MPN/PAD-1 family protein n=1 Tax=Chitinimonas viridis TaxID=664880 RepID=UPI003571646F